MDDFYVYRWVRPDTGAVFYVGKGRGYRDTQLKRNNSIFIRIVNKLSKNGLEPVIERTHSGLTEAQAFLVERAEIAKHGRINNGTGTLANLTDGGEGSSGWTPSEETRKKISLSKLGKKIASLSEQGRKNLSTALRGKPKSEEHKAKMSQANLGKVLSNETRAKIALANTGKIPSEETRAKISAASSGRTLSAEARAKISVARTGTKHSEQSRSNMSAAGKGKAKSRHHVENVTKSLRMNPNLSTSKSGLKGVVFRAGKYQARIGYDGVRRHLGTYTSAEEAGLAYDAAAIAAFGQGNCYLNFPVGEATC